MRLERSPDRPLTLVDHPDLAAVAARLAAADRRARSNRWLAALTIGVAGGLLILLALEIWRRFDPAGFDSFAGAVALDAARPLLQALAMAALPAIAIGAGALVVLARRAAPMIAMARSADRTFELKERISTAMEVAGHGWHGPVERALIGDAGKRAAAIQPGRLEPLRLPSLAWGGVAVLAFALILQFAPGTIPAAEQIPAAGSPAAGDLPPDPLAAAEQAQAAEAVTRIAAMIAAEAEETADPYLGAVGRTMAVLGEDIAAAETVDRNELVGELNRLLGHAQEAALRPAAFPEPAAAPELIENLIRDMAPPEPAAATPMATAAPANPGQGGAATAPTNDVANPVAMVPPGPERGIGDGTPRPPTEQMEGNLGGVQIRLREAEDDQVVNQARTGGAAGANAQPGNMGVETNQPPGQGGVQGQGQIGPQMQAGGPTRQGEVGGMDAGAAAQQPGAVGAPPPEADFAPDDGMLLEAREAAEGRRIRIEIPPPTLLVEVPVVAIPTPDAWVPLPEAEVAREFLNPEARDLVRRYFTRAQGGPAP
jgi:hypothetical protein